MRILKGYSKDEQKEFKGIKAIYGYPLAFLTSKDFEDDLAGVLDTLKVEENIDD